MFLIRRFWYDNHHIDPRLTCIPKSLHIHLETLTMQSLPQQCFYTEKEGAWVASQTCFLLSWQSSQCCESVCSLFTFADMYALDKLEQLKLSWMSCSGLKVCVSVSGTIDHKDIQDLVYPTSGETSGLQSYKYKGFIKKSSTSISWYLIWIHIAKL